MKRSRLGLLAVEPTYSSTKRWEISVTAQTRDRITAYANDHHLTLDKAINQLLDAVQD